MLLDAYVSLNIYRARIDFVCLQLGDTRMYVPVLGIHAHQIPLDPSTGQ